MTILLARVRSWRIAVSAFVLAIAATSACAEWPGHDISFMVQFGPGGATDLVARALTTELSRHCFQTRPSDT